ncbi:MAG: dihydroneopterin aldolase [Bacteroidota bacterium]
MALIALEGMRFYAYHGFYNEERKIGGYYVVDVHVETDLPRTAFKDDLYKTVNYETIHFICKAAMKKPTKLIETVAARIIVGIKKQFTKLKSVKVRIKKENPPLGGEVGAAIIELDGDFAPVCNRCKKPLVCFDKPGGCWCMDNRIDARQLSNFQSQYFKCKCKDCPLQQ